MKKSILFRILWRQKNWRKATSYGFCENKLEQKRHQTKSVQKKYKIWKKNELHWILWQKNWTKATSNGRSKKQFEQKQPPPDINIQNHEQNRPLSYFVMTNSNKNDLKRAGFQKQNLNKSGIKWAFINKKSCIQSLSASRINFKSQAMLSRI